MAERDHAPEETRSSTDRLIASAAFPALVALWFAALFGAGLLFLPPVLFDALFGDLAAFGAQTRIVVALGAASLGLLLGLFIANRVRSDQPDAAPARPRKSKRDARAPLDVRAALGLATDYDDDDDGAPAPQPAEADDDAFELSDEHVDPDEEATADLKAPIDDPHFASAWSDADAPEFQSAAGVATDRDFDIEPAGRAHDPFALLGGSEEAVSNRTLSDRTLPNHGDADWGDPPVEPARRGSPARYNPFADHLPADNDKPEAVRDAAHAPPAGPARVEEEFEEPASKQPRSIASPPPPPAWPEPRAQEPALSDLGVAELVERLARALQRENEQQASQPVRPQAALPVTVDVTPRRSRQYRHESALAPMSPKAPDVDEALRSALDRLSRLDDVA